MAKKRTVNTEEAADLAHMLLQQRLAKHLIRKALVLQCNGRKPIAPRSFERIMARAREKLQADTGKSRKDMRQDSKSFYEGIIGDPRIPPAVRVRAQEALDKLYRLCIPERVVITGTGEGGAIKTETTSKPDLTKLGVADLMKLRELRAKVEGGSPQNN